MTLDDIKAAIAAGHKVTGHHTTPMSLHGPEREVRVSAGGSLSLHFINTGAASANHVLYFRDNILLLPGVGEFLVDPLPDIEAKQYTYLVSTDGAGHKSVKCPTYDEAVEEAKRIAQKLKTVRVYVLRIDATVQCEHNPIVMET